MAGTEQLHVAPGLWVSMLLPSKSFVPCIWLLSLVLGKLEPRLVIFDVRIETQHFSKFEPVLVTQAPFLHSEILVFIWIHCCAIHPVLI